MGLLLQQIRTIRKSSASSSTTSFNVQMTVHHYAIPNSILFNVLCVCKTTLISESDLHDY